MASSLTACGGMPEEPEVWVCTPVVVKSETTLVDWDKSYAYCISQKEPSNPDKKKRFPLYQYLTDPKPILQSMDDYAAQRKWRNDMIEWGKKQCKVKL